MLIGAVALIAVAAFLYLIEDHLRDFSLAFRLAFWKEFHRVQQEGAAPIAAVAPPLVTQPGPGVEAPQAGADPIRWPDERDWFNVEIECPNCGDSFVPVTTAWLLEHAHEGLICPFCELPTGQQIQYEANA